MAIFSRAGAISQCILVFLFYGVLCSLSGCNSAWFYHPEVGEFSQFDITDRNISAMTLPSLSGNQLQLMLVSASSQQEPSLVIHFHGNAGNITTTSEKFDWLVGAGYDLLTFDYSGYGMSTGKPSPETTYLDSKSVLDYAFALQSMGVWKNIILIGTSLGGNILLYTLASYDELPNIELVVIDSSFLSYKEAASEVTKKNLVGKYFYRIPYMVISDEYAPITNIGGIPDSPVLVVHCVEDDLIPLHLGYDLYKKLPVTKKEFWGLERCAHARGFSDKYQDHRKSLTHYLLDKN